jgi:hypothetical protein
VTGDVFAAPGASGSGTRTSPASLASVLSGSVRVEPGHTIWLRGGTYSGRFRSQLQGTSTGRITVRSFPGETAVLDSPVRNAGDVLIIEGRYTDVRDIEVTMSDPSRAGIRDAGVQVAGDHNRLINTYIHDTGCGITSFSGGTNSEIYGNIVLNTGSTDRSVSCHSIYAANDGGSKLIEDNVWFGSYSYGLHLYTEGGALEGITVRGNVGAGANIIGGLQPVDRVTVSGNDFERLEVGYRVDNGSISITQNRFGWDNRTSPFKIDQHWSSVTFTGNTVYGIRNEGLRIENDEGLPPSSNVTWNGNRYYNGLFAYPTRAGDWPCCGVSFATWRADHPGWDTTGTWQDGAPPDSVVVRSNRYEAGRGMVVAHVATGVATVSVDPTAILSRGARYEVVNALDPDGAVVASGTWNGGTVSLPTRLTPVAPLGASSADTNPSPGTVVYLVRTVS